MQIHTLHLLIHLLPCSRALNPRPQSTEKEVEKAWEQIDRAKANYVAAVQKLAKLKNQPEPTYVEGRHIEPVFS